MVWGLVQGAGGSIRIDSELGAGTRFTIVLPVAGTTRRVHAAPAPVASPRQGTVLIVEDEVLVRFTAAHCLTEQGYRVLACADRLCVQDAEERRRFLEIGASADRIRVRGNAKYDASPPDAVAPGDCGRPGMGPLLVGGSTHHPEERWLVQAVAG